MVDGCTDGGCDGNDVVGERLGAIVVSSSDGLSDGISVRKGVGLDDVGGLLIVDVVSGGAHLIVTEKMPSLSLNPSTTRAYRRAESSRPDKNGAN